MARNSAQAERFRRLLEKIGTTQAELAREIDTPRNTVSRWALGQHEPGNIVWAYLELRASISTSIRGKT